MKKNLFFAALAVAAMSSCSQNEVLPDFSEQNAMRFSPYTGLTTKGAETTTETIKNNYGFSLYAFNTGADAWASAAPIAPNVMDNQSVRWDVSESVWTYSPLKYWTLGDNYSFFAYAPTSGSGVVPCTMGTVGVPTITYTVGVNNADFVAGQMVDETRTASSSATEAVNLNLKHQLTRLSFSAKTNANDDALKIVVKTMELVANNTVTGFDDVNLGTGLMQSGVYTFGTVDTDGTNTEHAQDGKWANTVATAGVDFSLLLNKANAAIGSDYAANQGVAVAASTTTATPLFADKKFLFLLPPNGATGLSTITASPADADDYTVQVKMTYDLMTEDGSLSEGHTPVEEKTIYFLLTAGTMKQGMAYNYTLTFDINGTGGGTDTDGDGEVDDKTLPILVSAAVVGWDNSVLEQIVPDPIAPTPIP